MKPFFIVGAPRSGTTMLRDLFKQVRELYSPEETHFFRWAAPFHGNEYDSVYKNNQVLVKHRSLDGVSDEEFRELYGVSHTKAEITEKYCAEVARKKGASSWFEKSPQNIYGLPLIAAQMPSVKIINIVRHPYDVVKSLLVGKVIKVDHVVGAANYWSESIDIALVCSRYLGERMLTVKYEDLVSGPEECMRELCQFLGLSCDIDTRHVKGRDTDYSQILTDEERRVVDSICGGNMVQYGYDRTTH